MNAQKQRTERTDNDRNSNGEALKREKRMRSGFAHSYIIQKTKKTSLENERMNI